MIPEQRLLNEAWEHVHKQGKPSQNKSTCLYRNGELGCAFAPVIKKYDPEMETKCASELIQFFSNKLHEWVLDVYEDFADDIQVCHDNAASDYDRVIRDNQDTSKEYRNASDEFLVAFRTEVESLVEQYKEYYNDDNEKISFDLTIPEIPNG